MKQGQKQKLAVLFAFFMDKWMTIRNTVNIGKRHQKKNFLNFL